MACHAGLQVAQEEGQRVAGTSSGTTIATGTTSRYKIASVCYPLLINHILTDRAEKNFDALPLPLWKEK